jgi:predicted small secreted protein
MRAVYRANAARESAGTFTMKAPFPARQGGSFMKTTILVTFAVAVLGVSACKDKASDLQNNVEKASADLKSRVAEDPDIQEAGQALKNAAKDGGKGVKQVVEAAKDQADDNATDKPKG